jgi:hypothetical protein
MTRTGDRVAGGFEEAVEEGGGVDAGQVEVDQEQVGALGPDHAEAVVEVGGGDDLVAVDQDGGGDLGDRAVVVDDEHLGRGLDGRGDLGRGLVAGGAGRPAGQVGVGRGDPEDLLEGGPAGQGLGRPVGPHAAHAPGHRLLLEGGLGGPGHDQLADPPGHPDHLEQPEAALVAGLGAEAAAGARPQPGPVDLVGAEAEQLEGPGVGLDRLRALRAGHPGQALAHHQGERRGDQERLDPMSMSRLTAEGAWLACRGGEHQMPRHRRLHGDGGGLGVADLAHHDDVGILAQDRPQAAGEGEPDPLVDLHLVDPGHLVLDRVLQGDHVDGSSQMRV